MDEAKLYVGTSGWQYEHWRGEFYPPETGAEERLAYYADQFSCVEIAESFYRLPERDALRRWLAEGPPPLRFTLVAPRAITHRHKLKGCERELDALFARLQSFADRFGPLVFKLPPGWRCNLRRLRAFLERLPEDFRYAFECRHPSWHRGEVYALLAEHRAALCIVDIDGVTTPLESTTDFVYLRLHGPVGGTTGNYRAHKLRGWAGRALRWQRQGKDVYLLFDNDHRAYAAKNAQRIGQYLLPPL